MDINIKAALPVGKAAAKIVFFIEKSLRLGMISKGKNTRA